MRPQGSISYVRKQGLKPIRDKVRRKGMGSFMPECRIYHHTPVFNDIEPKGWGIMEMVSSDKKRGIAGIFQLSDPAESETVVRLRGLDVSLNYKVVWDNNDQSKVIDGFILANQGIKIRLEGALTSELLLFEAIE